jgi:hypothetical protein
MMTLSVMIILLTTLIIPGLALLFVEVNAINDV